MTKKARRPLIDEGTQAGGGRALVAVLAQSQPASPALRTFRKLVSQIERKRQELKDWQAYLACYARRVATEYEPLRAQLLGKQREMVVLIDELLSQQLPGVRLRRMDRDVLHGMLISLLDLLEYEGPDAKLKYLREKHTDARRHKWEQEAESLLADVLGMPLDKDDGEEAEDAEEIFSPAWHRRREEEARQGPRGRSSSKARGAAPGRPEPAARAPSPSLREIFRKLVSALHPDRERDPEERARKNELMQRVNQAYDASDLLTLLSLQLQIEQIDAHHLSSLSAERLAQYNQLLRRQLAGLEIELRRAQAAYDPLGLFSRMTVQAVDRSLSEEISGLRQALEEVQADLVRFRVPGQLRARLEEQAVRLDQEAMQAMRDLDGLLDGPVPRPRRPRRRRRR